MARQELESHSALDVVVSEDGLLQNNPYSMIFTGGTNVDNVDKGVPQS